MRASRARGGRSAELELFFFGSIVLGRGGAGPGGQPPIMMRTPSYDDTQDIPEGLFRTYSDSDPSAPPADLAEPAATTTATATTASDDQP